MDGLSILFLFFMFFIAIAMLVIAVKTIRIVPQATVMLVERLGRFSRVAASGLNILVPFLDKPRGIFWTNVRPGLTSIDLREQYIDLPPQPVITRDNVTIHVDSVVYWQITDPISCGSPRRHSAVDDHRHAGRYGRYGFGSHAFAARSDQCQVAHYSGRSDRQVGRESDARRCEKYQSSGRRTDYYEKQMTAERTRRALVLQADGDRQASITRAEGEKQAAITRAEGEKESAILQADGAAQARLRVAAAEAEAVSRLSQAMMGHGNPAQYLITKSYIESLRDMTRGNNSKVIFMPVETTSFLSSIGAIKEMLSETGEKSADADKNPIPAPRPRELPR